MLYKVMYFQQFNSDVRLGPPRRSEPLIDVSIGPLLKFHSEESIVENKILIKVTLGILSKHTI